MKGSPEYSIEALDALDNEHLLIELKKSKQELFNLRFQKASGQLESHGRIRAVKIDIARMETFLRERELGIRTEPQSPVELKSAKNEDKATDKLADKSNEKSDTKSDIEIKEKKGLFGRAKKEKAIAGVEISDQETKDVKKSPKKSGKEQSNFNNLKVKNQKVFTKATVSHQKKGQGGK